MLAVLTPTCSATSETDKPRLMRASRRWRANEGFRGKDKSPVEMALWQRTFSDVSRCPQAGIASHRRVLIFASVAAAGRPLATRAGCCGHSLNTRLEPTLAVHGADQTAFDLTQPPRWSAEVSDAIVRIVVKQIRAIYILDARKTPRLPASPEAVCVTPHRRRHAGGNGRMALVGGSHRGLQCGALGDC
jgi:hypothetical protein